ncbi:MarR family winged helix-turn-helix transcriptional regulator [Amycolatopsis nigrescens]|uniref:MarR family winged helix-turn-helix transcriptional regulator n=1 Tax=Amycolatopsis nigrescens TaxID=381445 RepID=UPI000374ACB0|nr:MarR family winged helix-turn-helix transcriptional regulator [Amycolatopsis nigrescens]
MIDFDWLTEDEQRVYSAFSTMSRELFNNFDCDLKREVGIPRTYYEVLFVLGRAPDNKMRLTELARGTRSAPSRITHAVGKLAQDGLVIRRASPTDGRGWTVELSDRGIDMLRAAAKRHALSVRSYLLDILTERQRDELRRIGEKVIDRIGEVTSDKELDQGHTE